MRAAVAPNGAHLFAGARLRDLGAGAERLRGEMRLLPHAGNRREHHLALAVRLDGRHLPGAC